MMMPKAMAAVLVGLAMGGGCGPAEGPKPAEKAMTKPGARAGCTFMGVTAGEARHVIYVIDNSGSMLPAFDTILDELKKSVERLSEGQSFHVTFFSKDARTENPPKRLVPATAANKRELLRFLGDMRSSGWFSSPIPALESAFKAFKAVPGGGKVLYFVSEGFDIYYFKRPPPWYNGSIGTEAVIAWLRDHNADKAIRVYPVVLGEKPARETEEGMKQIASENGGEYRWIERKD